MTDKQEILVLDGDHKNTLAIVRHLGKTNKYCIDVISYSKVSIAFYSKYVRNRIIIPHPEKNEKGYLDGVLKAINQKKYITIIPVSYISFKILSAHKEEILKQTHVTVTGINNLNVANSKSETYKLSHRLDIPYPILYTKEDFSDVELPCVVKSPLELGKNMVDYAHSKDELLKKYALMANQLKNYRVKPIVQRYIKGSGAGFFAFYKEGKCQAYFMHRRIREYPANGGSSVVAEGYENEQIKRDGLKILDHLKWEGVAMVEFKQDAATGIYHLMEINAKFWGSLDLALECGVNFPKMLIDNALEKSIKQPVFLKERFQWILNGDVFHLFERPWIFFHFIADLFRAKNDIWLTDLKPNFIQFLYIPLHYYKKWFK